MLVTLNKINTSDHHAQQTLLTPSKNLILHLRFSPMLPNVSFCLNDGLKRKRSSCSIYSNIELSSLFDSFKLQVDSNLR